MHDAKIKRMNEPSQHAVRSLSVTARLKRVVSGLNSQFKKQSRKFPSRSLWGGDAEHFLLLCPSFDVQRLDLLAGIVELLRPFL